MMSDAEREELERLKSHIMRKDDSERQMIFNALSRIETQLAVGVQSVTRVEEEQKRTTKILFGDESDSTPGLIKRVDRVEGKIGLIWLAAGSGLTALAHTAWGWLSGSKQ